MTKKRNRWLVAIISMACVAVMCGCAALADSAPSSVGMNRNGTTCTLSTGDPLVITLDANPTTGYLWELAPDQGGCLALDGEPSFEPLSEMVGSGGTQRFVMRASRPGQQTVRLHYCRPWENDVPPAKTFVLDVTVQ